MTEMETRRELVEYVGSGDLTRNEQETEISWFGDSDRFTLTSYAPTVVKSALQHADAELEWCYVRRTDGQGERVERAEEIRPVRDQDAIQGVRATFPLGSLSVKGVPRNNNRQSKIISTPDEAERVASVFGNGGDSVE